LIVCFAVYFVVWQFYNKKGFRREQERVRLVRQKEANGGFGGSEKQAAGI